MTAKQDTQTHTQTYTHLHAKLRSFGLGESPKAVTTVKPTKPLIAMQAPSPLSSFSPHWFYKSRNRREGGGGRKECGGGAENRNL